MTRVETRPAWLRLWPLGLIVLVGLVLWADQSGFWRSTVAEKQVSVNCSTLTQPVGCTVNVDGREIRFGMLGEPKPLAPFQVWLTLPDSTEAQNVAKTAEARFTMEGMDMGFNLYTLRPDDQGVLRATVTLPICVTGRRDWNMILGVANFSIKVAFVTNL